jgi:hypothetical protein
MPELKENEDAPEGKGSGPLPVYNKTNRRPPMKRVYLYRVIDHHTVLAYELDRPNQVTYDEMRTKEIDTILSEIGRGDHGDGTEGLGSLTWRRRNYFVVVYEDPEASLIRGNAVEFAHDTFDNGLDLPEKGEVRRFFCINHMQKRGGGDLGDGQSESFKFTINHSGARPKDHTATGTNTGPP